MNAILTDLSPEALVAANEASKIEMYTSWFEQGCVEVHREPDVLWFRSNVPWEHLSGVFTAQFAPDRIDERIETILGYLSSPRVPMIWSVSPSSRPTDLAAHLLKHGLSHQWDAPGMAADLTMLNEDLPVPDRLRIVHVENAQAQAQWANVAWACLVGSEAGRAEWTQMDAGLGFSDVTPGGLPYYRYLGLLNEKPVATSALLLAAGVAGIYAVATLAEVRGQGLGTAMTLAALRVARRMGCRAAILQSSSKGFPVYRRLGFQQHCLFPAYSWAPDLAGK